MEKRVILKNAQQEPYSILMLDMQDDELEFYRRFVRRHGGALKPGPHRSYYVLYFPPGTQKLPNDPDDPQMQETYRLLYPDGICLTWYRLLILDGQPLSNTLLVPVEDEDWGLFEEAASEPAGEIAQGEAQGRPRIAHRGSGQVRVPLPALREADDYETSKLAFPWPER